MPQQYLTQQERKQKTIKLVSTILGTVAVLGLAVWGIVAMSRQDQGQQYLPPDISEVRADEFVLGNRDAKVTLIEFGDFQCPACKAYAPMVKRLNQDFPDQLRIVFRHFPLPQHVNGKPSSYAAEAAGAQGKFWEMVEILYLNQSAWESLGDPQSKFETYASQLGLDVERFVRDMNSPSVKNKVEAHKQSGQNIGVNSTPTFYLDGNKLTNVATYEQFKQLVEQALQ